MSVCCARPGYRPGPGRKPLPHAATVALAMMLAGCPAETDLHVDNNNDNKVVSFANDVQPILTATCAGCHSPGGGADRFGIALQLTADVSYGLLVNQPSVLGSELTLVVPGEAASSFLLEKVSSNPPSIGDRMPRFAPALSLAQIDLIRDWIKQGARAN